MKTKEELRKEIYEKTWRGELWGRNGAIALSKKRYRELCSKGRKREALSPISSAYYTASGNAFARSGEDGLFKKFFRLSRGIWCLAWANVYSDELKIRSGGIKKMTPDELDVRSRVCFKSRRLQEALQCSEEALSRWGLSPDTRSLLLFGLAEILHKLGRSRSEVERRYNEALLLCDKVRPTTSVRVYKSLGEYCLSKGAWRQALEALHRAEKIAKEYNLGDQETKLKALFKALVDKEIGYPS